jgi:predicted phosphodiesterase
MTESNYKKDTKFLQISKEVDATDPTVTWNNVLSVHQNYGKCDSVIGEKVHDGSLVKPPNSIRFVCISDTHGKHRKINVPDGDVLLHAGDITNVGETKILEDFAAWLGELPHTQKVVIAGNHDLTIDTPYFKDKKNYEHILRNEWGGTDQEKEEIKGKKELEVSSQARKALCEAPKNMFTYLEDDSTTVIGGYKIYGSPWQPEFYNWAFNLKRGEECAKMWEKIPEDTDILLTHGPPVGHGDKCNSGHNAGCVDLLARITDHVKPLFHVFGHIHEGYGATTNGHTVFVNPSTCTFSYKPSNPPLVFDLPAKE